MTDVGPEIDFADMVEAEADKIRAQHTGKPKLAADTGGAPKMRSVSEVPSIRSFHVENIKFIIPGIIADTAVTFISGDPGSGKTTLVTAWCDAIAHGKPFAGMPTEKRPVLFLDRENGLSTVVERFDRLGANDGPDFRYWGVWNLMDPPDPCSQIVAAWVVACDPKPVIVVDSLVAFNGGDENDAGQTREYMNQFRKLTGFGATVIVLGHTGKAETAKNYRGSSDIAASIDVGYKLVNTGEGQLGYLRLTAFKARFQVEPETVFTYRDGEFGIDALAASQTNDEIFRALLIANPGIKAAEFENLAADKGARRNRARQFISDGIVSGKVRVQKGLNNARFYHWDGATLDGDDQ